LKIKTNMVIMMMINTTILKYSKAWVNN
jgi:hypothetical protein